ncbi:hypothetical protein [Rhizobium fabae]|uniref:1,6-anhydro-N-acetylmuramate kinase n=1 Tax=Rhizobium fabae TaxID=573179 RepID=A0A7W6B690_9HYPH|nr:hypothetical protein [Rhizobium fabae]MBB3915761.1 1,6-anhydro-N-acetylmuramate kinase [Rhizobium fabae]RUM11522.1 hypothetical protein EFB14_18260 [Rhizobium fabae]
MPYIFEFLGLMAVCSIGIGMAMALVAWFAGKWFNRITGAALVARGRLNEKSKGKKQCPTM